jgi:hypothetical protein
MIGGVSRVRHAVVIAAVGATSLGAGLGLIGGGVHPERFDAKTIVMRPEGDGVRITEYVDIDFGTQDRRGYERLVPNDFGTPTDVTASTPDADDTVTVEDFGEYTRIRIGSVDRTFDGQHRYVLDYLLPDARFAELGLRVDVVSPPGGVYPGDTETGRFEVVVTGFDLRDTTCDVGALGAEGGCELERTPDVPAVYRAVLEPLAADAGLTVGGAIVGRTDAAEVDPPPIPERRSGPNRGLVVLGMMGLGAIGAIPTYRRARRTGSNEVFAGGAADAAYGSLPAPRSDGTLEPPPPVRLVPDADMDELVTIEFVPPKGIEPWEAQVLLRERIDDRTVEAWLSGLVGREAIELDEDDDDLVIQSGTRRGEIVHADTVLLDPILAISDPYVTGKYDKEFAAAWRQVHDAQVRRIADSGWWRRMPPGAGFSPKASGSPFGLIMVGGITLVWLGSAVGASVGLLRSWPMAVAVGLLFPAIVAAAMYRALLPSRSAQGSALALRSESFRRFLHASEGQHVEWAWSKGLLREYSAWAVALGEADAWSKALAAANVPAAAAAASGPIILHRHGSSMRDTRTAPSSSSGGGSFGGGGGGFGGGGVGGGGGGGSSGSW